MSAESVPVEIRSGPESHFQQWIVVLTGLGQIMFQDSPLTGGFFLTGIALVSPLMAAGALAGSFIGTATAYFLGYDRQEIRYGLFGYNAALVGIAMFSHLEPQLLTILLGMAGCVIATLLTQEMRRRLPVPTYTAPFIVTTWVAFYCAQEIGIPAVAAGPAGPEQPLDVTTAIVKGISEVMFQANVLTGALFIIGILLCSWKGAIWALVGSLLGLLTGMSHSAPEQNLSLGIYGYNAALVAMALALYRPSVLLPIAGAIMSVPFTEKMPAVGLPTLTTPFVLASWIMISLDRVDKKLDPLERIKKE